MRMRFGDVEVDGETRQIRRAGRGVHLSPKAFDLLTLLLSRRPPAVPKSESHRHLGAGTFVTDTSLPTLVAEVRDAIGDDAKRMNYVRTIHRFGYAFQGEVFEVQPAMAADSVGAWLVGAAARIGMA